MQSTRIPFVDFKAEIAAIRSELDHAMSKVLDSGWFIGGPEGKEFEREFADFVGTSQAVGVNSGSDALWLTLRALGIGPGDEVATVAHTFVSTVDAIIRCGATPRFVDIDSKTYTMDAESLQAAIGTQTKAVLPVHLYGHPADLPRLQDAAGDIPIIEDAAQAHGAKLSNRHVGTQGKAACFSFYPTKNLGALGDGGAISTDDHALATKLRMMREYGQQQKNQHLFVGCNSRLDEIQAAVLRVRLKHLHEDNQRRSTIAAMYDQALEGLPIIRPTSAAEAQHVYHLYVIRIPHHDRDQVAASLATAGIQTQVHYPTPVHLQPAYRSMPTEPLPVTEALAQEILSLPLHPQMPLAHVQRVATALRAAIT